MKIYTSYFGMVRNLPKNVVAISICGKAPDGWTGLQYRKLAPKYRTFMQWKQNHDWNFYIDNFKKEVLDTLDRGEVFHDLYCLAGGRDICLICYEKPGDHCHRHLVADWLNEGNIHCKEFDFGDGLAHF